MSGSRAWRAGGAASGWGELCASILTERQAGLWPPLRCRLRARWPDSRALSVAPARLAHALRRARRHRMAETCGYARLVLRHHARLVLRHQARDAARPFFFWFLARCCAGSWGALPAKPAPQAAAVRRAPPPAPHARSLTRCAVHDAALEPARRLAWTSSSRRSRWTASGSS